MLYVRLDAFRYLQAVNTFRLLSIFLFLGLFTGRPAPALAQDSQNDLFFYAIEDLNAGQVISRGTTGAEGLPRGGAILAPRTRYRHWLYQVNTGFVGFVEFETPSAGQRFTIPPVPLQFPVTPDSDGDELSDDAEFVVGTNPTQTDSDEDGILDGAEILQGLDPLEGSPARTGITASADTPGTAVDIDAFNDIVVVADSDRGVIVFNVFNRMNPVIIAQVDTPGSATRVSLSGDFIAVADGGAGLAIVDIRDPPAAEIAFQIGPAVLGGSAVAVTTGGGVAYVGLSSGRVVAVDLASGTVLEKFQSGGQIHDMGIERDFLFVLLDQELKAYALPPDFPNFIGRFTPLSFFAEGITRSRRLFVGGGRAYITSYPGFDVFDVSDPTDETNTQPVGVAMDIGPNSFKQIVANGSGLGVATVGTNPRNDGTHHVSLYDISDPTDTTRFLTQFETSGLARAVSLYNGLAYVCDTDRGLQVINYLAPDTEGNPPQVALDASFEITSTDEGESVGVAEEGKLVRVSALVTDDVQVRNVEFYVDGQRVATDGNFPFEYRFTTPRLADQTTFTLSARASDTGGNATFSDEVEVTLVPDATPPRIVRVTPRQGAALGRIGSLAAFANEPLETATLTPQAFRIVEAGADGRFDTDDDRPFALASPLEWREEVLGIFANIPEGLSPGHYRVEITTAITDLAGNALRDGEIWAFRVFDIADDRDGDGVPDALEELLGLDPDNPDTDGDGLFDGEEDFDQDGLTNLEEVVLGQDATNPDTDGDGVLDGDEDSDGDGLVDREEFFVHGTQHNSHDTDGDGFNDWEEIEDGSDPLDPNSTPLNDADGVGVAVGPTFSVFNGADPSTAIGVAVGPSFSVFNLADPSTAVGIAVGPSFSVFNTIDPSTAVGIAVGPSFSVYNLAAPSTTIGTTGIAVGPSFSLFNAADPSTAVGIAVGPSFSVFNIADPSTVVGIAVGPSFSLFNLSDPSDPVGYAAGPPFSVFNGVEPNMTPSASRGSPDLGFQSDQ